MNTVFKKGVEECAEIIRKYIVNHPQDKSPIGLFTLEDVTTIRTIFPQNECFATGQGREVEKFVFEGLPGNLVVGFSLMDGFKFRSATVKSAKKILINRGMVYAAVKYDGKWKAARIFTEL